MTENNFLQSNKFKWIVISIAGLLVAMVVFRAGMIFGFKQGLFIANWDKNYERNFIGRDRMMPPGFGGRDLVNAHGISGIILKTDNQGITVQGDDSVEKFVLVNDDTKIQLFMDSVKLSELKEGDRVVVIGSPNVSGQIEAKLIRVMPDIK